MKSIIIGAALTATVLICSAANPAIRKAIAIPMTAERIIIDGKADEAAWISASEFNDFQLYKTGGETSVKTTVKLIHDANFLYLHVKCFEPENPIIPVTKDGSPIWGGDLLEIFFGAMEPIPYVAQFCVSAGSGRYAGNGDYSNWTAKSIVGKNDYQVEIKLPLSEIRINNLTTSFNICRWRSQAKEYNVWQDVGIDFQSINRYGEIIFGTYNLAAQAKFKHFSKSQLSRHDYEKLNAEMTVKNTKLLHGPWLYSYSDDGVSVGWSNGGPGLASLEYRKSGDTAFNEVKSNFSHHAWNKDKALHKVRLSGLEAGTTYEYRIKNFADDEINFEYHPSNSQFYTFSTFKKEQQKFAFAMFTDLHNQRINLEKMLKLNQIKNCDFLVNVGDMLTNSNGIQSIFDGYLDAEQEFANSKPLFNVRGNHECWGVAPESFFELFGHPGGKSYFMERIGNTCIIFLDGGEDSHKADDEILTETNQWLQQAIKSDKFKSAMHRILICHMPILNQSADYTQRVNKMLNGVFTGKNPAAAIDVMLAGHTHSASYTPTNSTKTVYYGKAPKTIEATMPTPFPVICNDGPGGGGVENSLIYVEIDGKKLQVSIIDNIGNSIAVLPIKP